MTFFEEVIARQIVLSTRAVVWSDNGQKLGMVTVRIRTLNSNFALESRSSIRRTVNRPGAQRRLLRDCAPGRSIVGLCMGLPIWGVPQLGVRRSYQILSG